MALPNALDKTYAPGDKLNRSHLNNWQDLLRAIWRGRHGARWLQLAACDAWNPTAWSFNGTVYNLDSAPATLVVPIVLPVGARVLQALAHCNRAAAASVTGWLIRINRADGTDASLSGAFGVNPAGTGWTPISLTASKPVIASGFLYVVAIDGTSNNDQVSGLELEIDRP